MKTTYTDRQKRAIVSQDPVARQQIANIRNYLLSGVISVVSYNGIRDVIERQAVNKYQERNEKTKTIKA